MADFNVDGCMTAAGLSMKIFKQCFLNDDLFQSPDEIMELEKV